MWFSGSPTRSIVACMGALAAISLSPAAIRGADRAKDTRPTFDRLLETPGVSGDEAAVRDVIAAALPTWARPRVDQIGNLIVTVGSNAAESLLHRPISMQKDSGVLMAAEVPGATLRPALTTTGHKWARWVGTKEDRQLVAPYQQNTVSYPLIALERPIHVQAHSKDRRPGSPMQLFATGMKKAHDLYTRYEQEIGGGQIVESLVTEDDIYEAQNDAVTDYG